MKNKDLRKVIATEMVMMKKDQETKPRFHKHEAVFIILKSGIVQIELEKSTTITNNSLPFCIPIWTKYRITCIEDSEFLVVKRGRKYEGDEYF